MSNHYCISNPCPICMAGKEFPPDRFTFETPSGPFIGDAAADLRDAFIKGYTRGQQDARSVAHPPTSELVSAGNAMKSQLLYHERYDVDRGHDEAMNLEDIALANAWDAALAAHPKEVAPTVQEIGEQTPVAPIMVRALPYNEAMNQFDATAELEYTDCDRPLIEGWKWTPVHVVPAIPLYRFPMSSEARDLAFEALEDARIVVGNTHLIDQALSALRG